MPASRTPLPMSPLSRHRQTLVTTADPRVLSRAECEALFHRVVGFGTGEAETTVKIRSTWSLVFRWAHSRPIASINTTEQTAIIIRTRGGSRARQEISTFDDTSLQQAVQALDQQLANEQGSMINGLQQEPVPLLGPQQYLAPNLWSEMTAQVGIHVLSEAARHGVELTLHTTTPGTLMAAGYLEVGAASWAIFNTKGLTAYSAVTGAAYREKVVDRDGTASGATGQRVMEWSRLDTATLAKTAMERCVKSVNPVAFEPGRYTAILSAEVVSLMLSFVMKQLDQEDVESGGTVFSGSQRGTTKIGQQVLDARLTLTSDPMDPDCGFMPFDPNGTPYRKTDWIERGVLKALAYDQAYAQKHFSTNVALPNPLTFRCSGGPTATTSVEEMIATTDRGILVTSCDQMQVDDQSTLSLTAVTQDGLWLIEHGKIAHPIKNMWINESPMSIFNRVLQIGPTEVTTGVQESDDRGILLDVPARAVCDGSVLVAVPPMKVQDFTFIRLSDAV